MLSPFKVRDVNILFRHVAALNIGEPFKMRDGTAEAIDALLPRLVL